MVQIFSLIQVYNSLSKNNKQFHGMQIWRIISCKGNTVVPFVNAWVSIRFLRNPQSNDAMPPHRYGVKDNKVDQSCSKSFTGFMSGSDNTPSGLWSWIKAMRNSANTVSNRHASV